MDQLIFAWQDEPPRPAHAKWTSEHGQMPMQASARGSVAWLPATSLILSVLGLAVSGYLSYEHHTSATTLSCPNTATINCLKVTTSSYSSLLGMPVSDLGLAFFMVMTVLCLPALWRSPAASVRVVRLNGRRRRRLRVLPGLGRAVQDRRHLPVVHGGTRHRGRAVRRHRRQQRAPPHRSHLTPKALSAPLPWIRARSRFRMGGPAGPGRTGHLVRNAGMKGSGATRAPPVARIS